ncbi:MAG: hypothetical protein AAF138_05855 [Planctomycetota bacterium]
MTERNEFLLGPEEDPKSSDEERRRQEALRLEIERLAREHGLSVRATGETTPEPTVNTERAARIKDAAEPAMRDEAAQVKVSISRSNETTTGPDGTVHSRTHTELRAWATLGGTFKQLAKATVWPLKGSCTIAVKVGGWVKAKVTAKTADEEEPVE